MVIFNMKSIIFVAIFGVVMVVSAATVPPPGAHDVKRSKGVNLENSLRLTYVPKEHIVKLDELNLLERTLLRAQEDRNDCHGAVVSGTKLMSIIEHEIDQALSSRKPEIREALEEVRREEFMKLWTSVARVDENDFCVTHPFFARMKNDLWAARDRFEGKPVEVFADHFKSRVIEPAENDHSDNSTPELDTSERTQLLPIQEWGPVLGSQANNIARCKSIYKDWTHMANRVYVQGAGPWASPYYWLCLNQAYYDGDDDKEYRHECSIQNGTQKVLNAHGVNCRYFNLCWDNDNYSCTLRALQGNPCKIQKVGNCLCDMMYSGAIYTSAKTDVTCFDTDISPFISTQNCQVGHPLMWLIDSFLYYGQPKTPVRVEMDTLNIQQQWCSPGIEGNAW
mmetsp:Transcript_12900/g.23186  ORF Transcript_12900/g.23186 Transcript_12900/m.23186 type:complete len:394 (-) Transcript_12900:35-1216(-)